MHNDILKMAEEYNRLLDEKERLAERMKENNEKIERCRTDLTDLMMAADMPKFSHKGYSFTAVEKTKYSKKAGADEELFGLLRVNGLGDLIKETVNANSLNAAVSEIAAENDDILPPEFEEVLNVYSFTDIMRRRGSVRK